MSAASSTEARRGAVWTRGYPVLLFVLTAAVVAVEAALVEPGHLIEAQIADALLVLVIVNHGLRDSSRLPRHAAAAVMALRALALVPLIRVISLGLPLGELSDAAAVLLIAVASIVAVVVIAPAIDVRRTSFIALPLTSSALLAAAAGLPLGLIAYFAGAEVLWARGAEPPAIAMALGAVACGAIAEELIFRGAIQLTFERVAGAAGSLVATALFSATYVGGGSVALVLSYALAGLVFANSVSRTGALGGAILGHVLLALSAGALWPVLLGRTPAADLVGVPATVLWATIVLAAALSVAANQRGDERQP